MGQLKVIERDSTRVLTTEQLAEAFGTETAVLTRNFNRNKERYQEGKHYFLLTGEERKSFLNQSQIDSRLKHAHTIYLWTERGAFLHAKSLNTNKAWDTYSSLVDDYFNKVDQIQRANIPTEIPSTIEDVLMLAIGNMKEMKLANAELKQEVNHLKLVVDNEVVLTKQQRSEIQQAVDRRQGELNQEGYSSAHFQGIYKTLKTHFNVPSYSDIKRSDFEKAMNIIKGWYPKKKENPSH